MSAAQWWHRAACKGAPTEWFFPEQGKSLEPARAMCSTCPVSAECLAESLEDHGYRIHGVWAGVSMNQRKHVVDQPFDDRRSA